MCSATIPLEMVPELESQHQTLIDEIAQAQRSIFRAMQAAAMPTWLQVDLTLAQIKALFTLETGGPTTVGQLAAALDIGRPAGSILLDRLVQMGLVGRKEDAVDRRRAIIQLTPLGEELLTRLRQGRRERLLDSLGQMSDDDLGALLRGLRALEASLSSGR